MMHVILLEATKGTFVVAIFILVNVNEVTNQQCAMAFNPLAWLENGKSSHPFVCENCRFFYPLRQHIFFDV